MLNRLCEMELSSAKIEVANITKLIKINYVLQAINFAFLMCNIFSSFYKPTFLCGLAIGISGTCLLNLIIENSRNKLDLSFQKAKLECYEYFNSRTHIDQDAYSKL